MPMNSVSNSKLHCCLIILILFILIFLSLPLLLIYLANTRYEAWQNSRTMMMAYNRSNNHHAPSGGGGVLGGGGGGGGGQSPTSQSASLSNYINGNHNNNYNNGNSTTIINISPNIAGAGSVGNAIGFHTNSIADLSQQDNQSINCTQFALQAKLSLIGDNIQCPEGTFPCQSCPDICIEQRRNCDGVADCPDRTDESFCHDSNGAIGIIFQNIVTTAAKNKNKSATTSSISTLAKPDSCTLEQFVHEQCPCVFTDSLVIICEGLGLTNVPNTLLSSVYKIRMSNNSIETIDNVFWPKALTSLVLVHNHINTIGRSTFEMAPNLSKLYLSHNEISHIDLEAFAGLHSLTSLQIESNRLKTFDVRLFRHTPLISRVYLSENSIDLPEDTRFSDYCQNLKELLLDHNRISIIRSHWFSNMSSLIWLSLSYNQITHIEDGSFNWNYELEELNLSFNKIKVINRLIFADKLNIQRLYLGGNPLQTLPIDAFREIVQLKSLNLTHVDFDYLQRGTFSYLTQLEFIYFAKFRYCHYATHVRVCRPITDGLSSAEELLAFPMLKFAVWIVALVCILGNVFVFAWRSISPHEDRTLSLFVRNLSIADLMMGIYLGTIGWQDWKFQHNFNSYAIEWMSSWKCTAIGFLAILSSELSVFILTIITIERYRSIISIKKFEEETQQRRASLYVALAWLFAFLIAFYPIVEWMLRNSDYYATNGLCLPLHIDQPFTRGWQYSAFIYLGINFTAVIIIIALYIHMYSMIMDGRQVSRPVMFKAEKREDAILAIRFFFIVVTDCLCWIPIVVIKIMALANVSISSSIYGWLVVFIIPINSALNPIVYTLAAPTSLRSAVCKLFERFCYRIDTLTSGSGSNYSSHSSSNGSSQSESNMMRYDIISRGRKKTGSNSTTTCDTFETSIFSQSKASVDTSSALIHHTMVADIEFVSMLNAPNQRRSSSPPSPSAADNNQFAAAAAAAVDNRFKFEFGGAKLVNSINTIGTSDEHSCHRHHMTNDRTIVNRATTMNAQKRPYDCLTMYENNAVKLKIVPGDEQRKAGREEDCIDQHEDNPSSKLELESNNMVPRDELDHVLKPRDAFFASRPSKSHENTQMDLNSNTRLTTNTNNTDKKAQKSRLNARVSFSTKNCGPFWLKTNTKSW